MDASGKTQNHLISSDSYKLDDGRPIVAPCARQLISLSGSIDESLIDHVLAGGGCIGAAIHSSVRSRTETEAEIVTVNFEIDFILFYDGEIGGPDAERYALELNCRKPAAEFVARHIRLAKNEGRDVTPVLAALADHVTQLQLASYSTADLAMLEAEVNALSEDELLEIISS